MQWKWSNLQKQQNLQSKKSSIHEAHETLLLLYFRQIKKVLPFA